MLCTLLASKSRDKVRSHSFASFICNIFFQGCPRVKGGGGGIPHSFILECLIHFKLSLLWRQSSQAVDSRSKHVFCQGCHSAILPIYIKCLFKLLWSLSYYEVGVRWAGDGTNSENGKSA